MLGSPGGEIGRRSGLKIRHAFIGVYGFESRPGHHAGSPGRKAQP